jgi:hypothetical protein
MGQYTRKVRRDMPKDHVWPLLRARVDTVWQTVSKYSFGQPVRDGLRHWELVSKCFFIVSSSKYVRSRVLKFLSETQRWDPKSTQALLIKKSDHSRYLYTHLQRHIKETQFQIPIRINKYTNTYEVVITYPLGLYITFPKWGDSINLFTNERKKLDTRP